MKVFPLIAISLFLFACSQPNHKLNEEVAPTTNDALPSFKADNHYDALERIEEALMVPNLTPYEKSTLFIKKGQAHMDLEQVSLSIEAFEEALTIKELEV